MNRVLAIPQMNHVFIRQAVNPIKWPIGTRILAVFIAAVYVVQQIVYHWMGPRWEIVIFHRIHGLPEIFWGYIMAIFSHKVMAPLEHFAMNLGGLVLLGIYLEPRLGTRDFLWLFVLTGVASGIVGSLLETYDSSLGASGSVLGLAGVLIAILARERRSQARLIWVSAITLWLILFLWAMGHALAPDGVGHVAHFMGFSLGLAWGIYALRRRLYHQPRLTLEALVVR